MQRLAQQLTRYRHAVPPGWTWILVRSKDWHYVLLKLGLDSQSPAFTVLARQQTFLSEALFEPGGESGAELLKTFRVPLDRILDVAITHELGHAYCEESREGNAEHFAEQLRTGVSANCSPQHPSADARASRYLPSGDDLDYMPAEYEVCRNRDRPANW